MTLLAGISLKCLRIALAHSQPPLAQMVNYSDGNARFYARSPSAKAHPRCVIARVTQIIVAMTRGVRERNGSAGHRHWMSIKVLPVVKDLDRPPPWPNERDIFSFQVSPTPSWLIPTSEDGPAPQCGSGSRTLGGATHPQPDLTAGLSLSQATDFFCCEIVFLRCLFECLTENTMIGNFEETSSAISYILLLICCAILVSGPFTTYRSRSSIGLVKPLTDLVTNSAY
jgi:hypothetical protein